MKERVNFGLRRGYEAPRAINVEIESDGLILAPSLPGSGEGMGGPGGEKFDYLEEAVWDNP